MNNFFKVCVLTFLFSNLLTAQNIKFGKVSKEELKQKFYEKDSTADAIVLYRKISVRFEYSQTIGFRIIKEVYERRKIYNKGGFKYGTVIESLYHGRSDDESLTALKAYTYNIVGGEIEKTKLKGSDTFTEETTKYYKKEKFTMPKLKEGSVVEFKYEITSPYFSSFNEILLQYDIPIVEQEIKVVTPEYFVYKNASQGYLPFKVNSSTKAGSLTLPKRTAGAGLGIGGRAKAEYGATKIDFINNVSVVNMNHVPALKKEVFVNSMNNYRSAIKYELQYIKYPNSPIENYTGTWEKIVKKIYEHPEFGNQLHAKRFYKDDLAQVLSSKTDEIEKVNAIFRYVQSRMNWNGLYGYYTDEGVKKAYGLKTGNVADINLLLVNMLQSSGLKANPVLVSTRSNGVPLFPTRQGFNYVVAVVEIGGKNIFMDATSKFSKLNMMPKRTLNWAGRIVKEGGGSTAVSLFPNYVSIENIMMSIDLSAEGNVKGKARRVCRDYRAYNFRSSFSGMDEETYLGKIEEKFSGVEIDEYKIKNKTKIGAPVNESFSFVSEAAADVIGDKIYVSPLFWFTKRENPFKLEERNYPVDYAFPWEDKFMVTVKIPEGYKIESIPEPVNIAMEEGVAEYKIRVASVIGGFQVLSNLKMNQAVIPPHQYEGLKEFYKALVEKQTEKVVLSKI